MTNKGFAGYPTSGNPSSVPIAQLAPPHVYGYLRSGAYYFTTGGFSVSTSAAQGIGTLRLAPWFVPNTCTLTRLGAEVSTTGDSGSVVRLGIYADDGMGLPGALVLDAGTIAGDSQASQQITVSQTLQPGLYWVGGAVQTVTTTQPTLRIANTIPNMHNLWWGTTQPGSGGVAAGCISQTSVTGGLPGSITSPANAGNVVRTFVKIG